LRATRTISVAEASKAIALSVDKNTTKNGKGEERFSKHFASVWSMWIATHGSWRTPRKVMTTANSGYGKRRPRQHVDSKPGGGRMLVAMGFAFKRRGGNRC
jgi:hypothetical protein